MSLFYGDLMQFWDLFQLVKTPDCFRGPEEVRNAFVGSKSLADRREIQLSVLLLQYN